MHSRVLFTLLFGLLLLSPAPGGAEPACYTVVNQTPDEVAVRGKSGNVTDLRLPLRTARVICCDEPGCFHPDSETAKLKVMRMDPNGYDEWSSPECNPVRIGPGMTLFVSADVVTGPRPVCNVVEDQMAVPPFKQADRDGSGGVDMAEAERFAIGADDFARFDENTDGKLNAREYERAWTSNLFEVRF